MERLPNAQQRRQVIEHSADACPMELKQMLLIGGPREVYEHCFALASKDENEGTVHNCTLLCFFSRNSLKRGGQNENEAGRERLAR